MAQTDTRPGFRLPWSSDRADAGDPTGAATDASTDFGDAPATEEAEGTAMIEAASAAQDTETPEAVADLRVVEDAEPEAPAAEAEAVDVVLEAPVVDEPAPVTAKAAKSTKSTKFLADLTKAMQATAEAAKDETLERFAAEAKAATEKVQANAAEEITDLRRSADDDVAAIREWSKGEIARIREETETRISTRKTVSRGRTRGPLRCRRAPRRTDHQQRRRLRGRDGRVLRATLRRGRPRDVRGHGRADARAAEPGRTAGRGARRADRRRDEGRGRSRREPEAAAEPEAAEASADAPSRPRPPSRRPRPKRPKGPRISPRLRPRSRPSPSSTRTTRASRCWA